jgi:hypothetical protein
MADASVQTVNPAISTYSFSALATPNQGDVPGNDWP